MKRREFITLVGGAAAWPVVARAQLSVTTKRIGVLMPYVEDDPQTQECKVDILTVREFVYYKLERFDDALADYVAVLKSSPDNDPFALFGRGLVKLRKNDTESGNADIAAAKAMEADIVDYMMKVGIVIPNAKAQLNSATKPS